MTNKKTLYIHLGINKTGSTAIESYCVDYFEKLIDHDITFFPKPHFYKHCWPIYFSNPDKPDIETYLKHHFNAFINFCKTNNMFLVDEDLSALNPFFEGFLIRYTPVEGQFTKDITYRLEKLQALTTDLNTKYIIYLRRQDLFLESLYSQIIKQRHFFTLPFSEFLNVYPPEYLNWLDLIHKIENCVGKENLIIKLFEPKQFFNNDIVHDCLNECNINTTDLPLSKRENSRIRSDVFENIRAFNALDLKIDPIKHYRATPLAICQSVNDKAYGFFTPNERKTFLEQFNESNSEIAKNYFNNEHLFSNSIPTEIINQDTEITLTKAQIKLYSDLYFPKPKKKKNKK